MDKLKNLKYSDFGVKPPYVETKEGFKYNEINSRLTDLERFTKLLTSKPGLKFQGNQALLQQTNILKDLRDGKGNLGRNLLNKAVKTGVNNIANTLSILAQVPVNGTGTHFILGLTPSGYLQNGAPRETAFGQFLAAQGIGGGVNGAKSALLGQSIGSAYGGPLNAQTELLSKYEDGDMSSLLSDQGLKTLNEDGNSIQPYLNKVVRDLIGNKAASSLEKAIAPKLCSPVSTDVVKTTKSVHWIKDSGFNTPYVSRYGLDDLDVQAADVAYGPKKPFEASGKRSNSSTYKIDVDKQGNKANYITSPIYIESRLGLQEGSKNRGDVMNSNYNVEQQSEKLLGSNIIPFEFNILTPEKNYFIYFRALLDSLGDSYNGQWNGTKYIGRAENFYTYEGFERTTNFSFKVAAFSKEELKPLYRDLNYLVGTTAPTYSQEGNFMRGTLVTLTIGEYLDKVTGYISNVELSWQTEYPWEIDLYDENLYIVPHILDVTVNFTPIHDFNAKSDINVERGDVYIGPKVPKVKPTPRTDSPETQRVFFEGTTVDADKDTGKVLRINNQPIPEDYHNYGLQYDPQFQQQVHISPDGNYKFDPVKRKWVTNNL